MVEATAFEEPVEDVIAEEDGIVDEEDHAPAQEIHVETLGSSGDVIGDEHADKAVADSDILGEASAPVANDVSIPAVEPEPASVTPDNDSDLAPSAEEKIEPTRVLKTVRFVWKIDASGRFSEVSREFADAVGPHAADISGMAFSDLAALFNLDPDGKIAELLSRRDTWSGRTIWWPVEGTSLVVPVDLAALPTYTRTREFDGFRGFGIVRMGDAAEDPNAAGLSLGKQQDDDGKPEGFADAMISAGATVAEEARNR
jgi:hypothetical protein